MGFFHGLWENFVNKKRTAQSVPFSCPKKFGYFLMVEAAGVEPASENMFLGISPSAVSLFTFPSVVTKDKGERSVASSIHPARQSLFARRSLYQVDASVSHLQVMRGRQEPLGC